VQKKLGFGEGVPSNGEEVKKPSYGVKGCNRQGELHFLTGNVNQELIKPKGKQGWEEKNVSARTVFLRLTACIA